MGVNPEIPSAFAEYLVAPAANLVPWPPTSARLAVRWSDAVGSADSLRAATQVSEAQSRVVLVSMQAPRLELDASAISTAERQLIGSFSYYAEEFRQTAGWLADHPEPEQPVDAGVGWSGAPEAFRSLADGESAASKIIFRPGKD